MWLGNDACNTTRAGCAANEHTLEREEEDILEREDYPRDIALNYVP